VKLTQNFSLKKKKKKMSTNNNIPLHDNTKLSSPSCYIHHNHHHSTNSSQWILLDPSCNDDDKNNMNKNKTHSHSNHGITMMVDPNSGNVVSISTRYCNNNQRWKTTIMPSLIQKDDETSQEEQEKVSYHYIDYSHVTVLDLHNSRYIMELDPNIGNDLPNLQCILLTRCNRLQSLPKSICSLQYLMEVKSFLYICI
jgi:hypothetical protein